MGLLLNIETSTNICSVALAKNGRLLSCEEDPNMSHSRLLTIFIQSVLKKNGYTFNDLDAVAISSGPGSFTGLKIGASTAKGICYASGCKLISVETLKSLASTALKNVETDGQAASFRVIPMLDARRMEVYCAVYDVFLNEIEPAQAHIVGDNSFGQHLNKHHVIFVGNGVQKCRHFFQSPQHSATFLHTPCSASNMIEESDKKFNCNEFENLAYFEPFYLKPANAKVQSNILGKILTQNEHQQP